MSIDPQAYSRAITDRALALPPPPRPAGTPALAVELLVALEMIYADEGLLASLPTLAHLSRAVRMQRQRAAAFVPTGSSAFEENNPFLSGRDADVREV